MIKSLLFLKPPAARRAQLVSYSCCWLRPYSSSSSKPPFKYADIPSTKETLENFPNLEGFINIDAGTNTSETHNEATTTGQVSDPFDFSDIPFFKDDDIPKLSGLRTSNDSFNTFNPRVDGDELSGIDFNRAYGANEVLDIPGIEKLLKDNNWDDDKAYVSDIPPEQSNPIIDIKQKHNKLNVSDFKKFKQLLNGDVSNPKNKLIDLYKIVTSKDPVVLISSFHNPYINLALENYIYDHTPVTHTPHSHVPRRLIFYKNNPCIVIGKNQNPFKELNLHYSNLKNFSLLRRNSGGGTVVHDLGNMNFSFIDRKEKFNRTHFTDLISGNLNELVGQEDIMISQNKIVMPKSYLSTNEKGDIINKVNEKKISGSAFKLSKGKSLHHGTMLLNADLKALKNCLNLHENKKTLIKSKGTDSISSHVENYDIDEDLFIYSCYQTFIKNFCDTEESSLKIVILDNFSNLPVEVIDYSRKIQKWSWVFGKTPDFTQYLYNNKYRFKIEVEVKSCYIKNFKIEKMFNPESLPNLSLKIDSAFAELNTLINVDEERIKFHGEDLKKFIDDEELKNWISWEIDYNIDYQNFNISIDE